MRYRTRPEYAEAIQFDGVNVDECLKFANATRRPGSYYLWAAYNVPHRRLSVHRSPNPACPAIVDGSDANQGDYIVRHSDGTVTLMRPREFERLYEVAE